VPYLDNNATTQPLPDVVGAVGRALTELWHNPSSVHRPGQAARHAVELARADLARLCGVRPREMILTGSGTESIDLAIRGSLAATGRPSIVTTAVEHAAVRDLAGDLARTGTAVRTLPLDGHGVVDAGALPELLGAGDVAVVSVQWANNETGAIMPVERIHAICREHRVAFHCDATQWVGKLPIEGEPPCDLLTASAHKFHGPKGVGVLWVRRGIGLRPTLHGSQELGRRGGTENVPGILGAGVAARAALEWLADNAARAQLALLRDRFERAVLERCPGATVNGPTAPEARLWNTTNIGFPRLEAEALLLAFSERGLASSAGAACSSGSLDPSPVLLAMGVPEPVAHGSVRFSLSRFTTEGEIDEAIEIVAACVERSAGGLALP
jgi:cysteine desulfurase